MPHGIAPTTTQMRAMSSSTHGPRPLPLRSRRRRFMGMCVRSVVNPACISLAIARAMARASRSSGQRPASGKGSFAYSRIARVSQTVRSPCSWTGWSVSACRETAPGLFGGAGFLSTRVKFSSRDHAATGVPSYWRSICPSKAWTMRPGFGGMLSLKAAARMGSGAPVYAATARRDSPAGVGGAAAISSGHALDESRGRRRSQVACNDPCFPAERPGRDTGRQP